MNIYDLTGSFASGYVSITLPDPFDLTPSEIGRICAGYPVGRRADALLAMIAAKPYNSGAMFQLAADRALLEMVRFETGRTPATTAKGKAVRETI